MTARSPLIGIRRKLFLLSLTLSIAALGMALVTGSASAGDTQCVGPLLPGTYDNVVVPPDADCTIVGTDTLGNRTIKILGNLKIEPNAGIVVVQSTLIFGNLQGEQFESLALHDSEILGNVQVKKQGGLEVCGNTIRGDLQVEEGTGGLVMIGYTGIIIEPDCSGNTIQYGNIKVEKNTMTHWSWIQLNTVDRGNLQVFENNGWLNISDNEVPKGNLQCSKNSPPPTGGGNTAKQKEEQCRYL